MWIVGKISIRRGIVVEIANESAIVYKYHSESAITRNLTPNMGNFVAWSFASPIQLPFTNTPEMSYVQQRIPCAIVIRTPYANPHQ